jgi:hypothetical protein
LFSNPKLGLKEQFFSRDISGFLYTFVFSPDHNRLLSVRKHKKERTALADKPSGPDSAQEPNAAHEDPRHDPERDSLAPDDAALANAGRISAGGSEGTHDRT